MAALPDLPQDVAPRGAGALGAAGELVAGRPALSHFRTQPTIRKPAHIGSSAHYSVSVAATVRARTGTSKLHGTRIAPISYCPLQCDPARRIPRRRKRRAVRKGLKTA